MEHIFEMPDFCGRMALYISSSCTTVAPTSSTLIRVAFTGCEGSNERFTSTMEASVV